MRLSRAADAIRDRLDFGDAIVYFWFLAGQPLAGFLIPGFRFAITEDMRHVLMGAACLNFINLFILMLLVQERYVRTGIPAGLTKDRPPRVVEAILNPVILILVNGCLTIMAIGFYTGYGSGSAAVTFTVIIALILVLVAGAAALGRVTVTFYDENPRFMKAAGFLRQVLAAPMIIAGAEACRLALTALPLRGADGVSWSALAVLLLAEGPVLYALGIFLLRAAVMLEVPTGRWFFRYCAFIAVIVVNALVLS